MDDQRGQVDLQVPRLAYQQLQDMEQAYRLRLVYQQSQDKEQADRLAQVGQLAQVDRLARQHVCDLTINALFQFEFSMSHLT